MKINLIVIRTNQLKSLKKQYELLGFVFNYHQHGNGPFHYSSENFGFVFEIYPLTKSMVGPDKSLRLGFEVENLVTTMDNLKGSNRNILSEITNTKWGTMAIIQDLDGRKIEVR